ncbi:MAG: tetratricopeptide repeat protein [Amphritea sp.]|nr:tetratricopeptide repeat protein [Amphritea sp.]
MSEKSITNSTYRTFKTLTVISLAGTVAVMSGCGSVPLKQNSLIKQEVSQELKQQDTSEVGVAYMAFGGNDFYPMSIWLNDLPIATQTNGYARVPLLPGQYRIKAQAQDHSPDELEFSVGKGETAYFLQDGSWVFSPYVQVSADKYAKHFSENEYVTERQVQMNTHVYKFLPDAERTLVENCLTQNTFAACEPVYNNIPLPLLGLSNSKKVAELVEKEQARLAAQQAQEAFEASLPKDVLRDKYMLALSDALTAKDYTKAVPIFKRLESLNIPLDPDFYYFYGEALFETGQPVDALNATSQYVRGQGNQARFYQDALKLLNKIQDTL